MIPALISRWRLALAVVGPVLAFTSKKLFSTRWRASCTCEPTLAVIICITRALASGDAPARSITPSMAASCSPITRLISALGDCTRRARSILAGAGGATFFGPNCVPLKRPRITSWASFRVVGE